MALLCGIDTVPGGHPVRRHFMLITSEIKSLCYYEYDKIELTTN